MTQRRFGSGGRSRRPDSTGDFVAGTLAEGTDAEAGPEGQPRPEFRVTIHYREPEYETKIAPREQPFRWTYRVAAEDRDRAADIALREFRTMARLSSVGWRRDIVAVTAEPAEPLELAEPEL